MTKAIYTEHYRKLAKKLENSRKEANYTQGEAAKSLKKSQSYISKVEAGQQRIDIIELSLFAKLYKKPIDYFHDL
ncbi:MAG: helix-turn-helix transcriptional regulator [Candidatus Omnitrophica bacterium]|nr:helix-turn-helix transcriptional regulator [Candidatus Omnitrophota bacterium]